MDYQLLVEFYSFRFFSNVAGFVDNVFLIINNYRNYLLVIL